MVILFCVILEGGSGRYLCSACTVFEFYIFWCFGWLYYEFLNSLVASQKCLAAYLGYGTEDLVAHRSPFCKTKGLVELKISFTECILFCIQGSCISVTLVRLICGVTRVTFHCSFDWMTPLSVWVLA